MREKSASTSKILSQFDPFTRNKFHSITHSGRLWLSQRWPAGGLRMQSSCLKFMARVNPDSAQPFHHQVFGCSALLAREWTSANWVSSVWFSTTLNGVTSTPPEAVTVQPARPLTKLHFGATAWRPSYEVV